MSELVQRFQEYSSWRNGVLASLERYRACVGASDLADAASDQRFARLQARLVDDKLSIAFVAEFSRGKSELINAIFFADYGQRILPSSAGRTTMCPTELLYDETFPPSIRLLPIETRAEAASTSDFKEQSHVWTVLPLDISSGEGMLEAFKQVSLTKRVSIEEAKRYGLYQEDDPDAMLSVDQNGLVEISQWRHAIVNFPHPLLKQGLVIIDTPGLNAIGTEPELTLNLIPNAHAVLFILAADTGVTKSDIDVWRNHIGSGPARMVVLNKIDSMWDELRSAAEVEQQISRQVDTVAQTLGLASDQVFPISAQKGLVGKVNHDPALLAKSRLPLLESALSAELIPSKQEIVREQLLADLNEMAAAKQALLASRSRNVVEQLVELKSLRGKNQNIIEHMMKRVDLEKKDFDSSLLKLQGTRAVFTRLSTEVFTSLGMDILKEDIALTREDMEKSRFSTGLRAAVKDFFARIRNNLVVSGRKTEEITEMMTIMYRKFSTEHGLALSAPMPFSLDKYLKEIELIEGVYHKQFGTAVILTTPQVVLMTKFFDSIASRVKQSFLQANRDVEAWLKVVMAPLEAQIWEHKAQLKKRRQSIERIHMATESLEEKVEALEQMQADLDARKKTLSLLESELRNAIIMELAALKAAA
ncbi:dynamin family protein [Noviherbaspirillum sp. CPCC 100848]|uniref:Dynamin family protein n=1 Tax=Noviherbaspirillum album TaxID=3080276 RepID=A0ABU6J6F9_9BURK|nr:dynamin family protein [Noviherbaspirillum sp. CPCC 100848]MEC4719113.1 dynamin family protein [Noviherbaspirillum sp. CPCC 100848]